MAGIGLGVAALIVVLSVMNGFQKEVRDRMLSVLPHVEIFVPGPDPLTALEGWQTLVASRSGALTPSPKKTYPMRVDRWWTVA
jgi:lipoprotein-releasing system permease protein